MRNATCSARLEVVLVFNAARELKEEELGGSAAGALEGNLGAVGDVLNEESVALIQLDFLVSGLDQQLRSVLGGVGFRCAVAGGHDVVQEHLVGVRREGVLQRLGGLENGRKGSNVCVNLERSQCSIEAVISNAYRSRAGPFPLLDDAFSANRRHDLDKLVGLLRV
jgi:hypothetical protein